MAFAYGHMSLEDVLKYDMQLDYKMAVPVKFGIEIPYIFGVWTNLILREEFLQKTRSAYIPEEWVVDREKDCYLRYGGTGSPQTGVKGQTNFMLYYQGNRIYVALEMKSEYSDDSKMKKNVKISLVYSVVNLGAEVLKNKMLILLKEALVIFLNENQWWFGDSNIYFINF